MKTNSTANRTKEKKLVQVWVDQKLVNRVRKMNEKTDTKMSALITDYFKTLTKVKRQ